MIEWRFKPNSRDDMDVDPIQGEFFTTRDIDNISTAVVREGIQNLCLCGVFRAQALK